MRTSTSDEVNVTLLEGWSHNDLVLFYHYQSMFFVPFFDIREDRLRSYILDHRIRLPWLRHEHIISGGNGMVHQIEIHPSHHNFRSVKVGKSFALNSPITMLMIFSHLTNLCILL
jgi:hypothetical protein